MKKAAFIASCLIVASLPFFLVDKVNVPIMTALSVGAWIAFSFLNRAYRTHMVLFGISLAAFVVAGELYFRVHYFGVDGLSLDSYRPASYGHPWSAFQYDEKTYTGLKPNATFNFRGKFFEVNSLGFRGPDYPFEKAPGTYRIVLAGASATIGTGLSHDEILTSILERQLNATNLPQKVEIINLSVGGSRFGEMLDVVKNVAPLYHPDMIMFLANETLIPSGEMAIQPRKVLKVQKSKLAMVADQRYDFFANRFFFINLVESFRDENVAKLRMLLGAHSQSDSSVQDKKLVQAFNEINSAKGDAEVVLYLLRPIADLANRNDRIDYRTKLAKMASGYGMKVISTYEASFDKYTEAQLAVYPGDKHPNAMAQNIYADAMLPELVQIIEVDQAKKALRKP